MTQNLENTQEVAHIATPCDYFGDKISDKPIFGIKNFFGQEFKPIYSKSNNKAVFYMTDAVRFGDKAPMLKDTMPRDTWEYFRYAQLDMANKFEDTLAYREKMGIQTNKEVLYALQYLMLGMLRYSNFNFLIDFNELNRISLAPVEDARKELFMLIAAATENINWTIIKNSKLDDEYPTLGRELFFRALALTNTPPITIKDIDTYLYRYDFLRDEVLKSEASTPWAQVPYEGLDAHQFVGEFYQLEEKCTAKTAANYQSR